MDREDLHDDLADLEHGDRITVRTETTEFGLEIFHFETAGPGHPPDTFILWCWPLDRRNDRLRMFFFISMPGPFPPTLQGYDYYGYQELREVEDSGRVDDIDLDTE